MDSFVDSSFRGRDGLVDSSDHTQVRAIPFPVAALLVLMLCAYLGFFSYLFFVLVKILTVRLAPLASASPR